MYLVIGEKPSVAQALAKVLGAKKKENGYLAGKDCLVSWCLGHLAHYEPPEFYDQKYEKWEFSDLPIVPEEWGLAVAKDKKKQFEILKELLNCRDLEYVVNACDAGREGELIFKRVYDLSGSRIPVKRLWISSMEDAAIRDGFSRLKDGKAYENLGEASVCRARADWLIGMNATRAFSTKYYKKLIVGRVQTPTLAMLAERQEKIDCFVKEPYYTVTLYGNGISLVSGHIKDETECDTLVWKCQGRTAVIKNVEKKQKKKMPPKLYDLTTLQREANRIFGYTAQETLQELQELYEARMVTYPRTDSQYITADMEQTVLELLEFLPEMLGFLHGEGYGKNVGQIINNEKVTDHHALLPTREALKKDRGSLSVKQQNLFCLIVQRLTQAVSEAYLYEETAVTAECAGHEFFAKGKSVVQPGFTSVESNFREFIQKGKDEGKEETGLKLDGIQEGRKIQQVQAEKNRHFTSPPRPFTEDTLLSAMETAGNQEFEEGTEKKGLGTPATRASIIEKLVSSGYAVRRGKQIIPTTEGKDLIAVLPDYLKSPALTAEWENRLLLMEGGQLDSSCFMQGILDLLDKVLVGCREIPENELWRFHPREMIGICPVCGGEVYEGKKNFYCSNRECSFCLWKENRYLENMRKQIDNPMAKELLEKGRTHIKDLYSPKKGRAFAADLVLDTKDGRVNFGLEFPKGKKNNKSGRR